MMELIIKVSDFLAELEQQKSAPTIDLQDRLSALRKEVDAERYRPTCRSYGNGGIANPRFRKRNPDDQYFGQ